MLRILRKGYTQKNRLSLPYAAGFIDGDGCICFTSRHRNVSCDPFIQITTTHKEIASLFRRSFGGTVHCYDRDDNLNWRSSITWKKGENRHGRFLCRLLPSLIIKRRQAELCLAANATKKIPNNAGLRPDVAVERRRLSLEMKELNRKGVGAHCPHHGEINPGYLAGLFDAEGCVTIEFGCGISSNNMHVRAMITNRCKCVLEKCQNLFGGSILARKRYDPLHSDVWNWRVCSQKAYSFLEFIRPHVVVKQPQVELAIKFRELNAQGVTKLARGFIKVRQCYIRDGMMVLNERGRK